MSAFLKALQTRYQAVLLLTLMTFTLRALMPAGFMPVFSADAGASIVICSGFDIKAITPDGEALPHNGDDAGQPCGFSVNTAGLDAVPAVVSVASSVPGFVMPFRAERPVAGAGHFYSTRAPPVV